MYIHMYIGSSIKLIYFWWMGFDRSVSSRYWPLGPFSNIGGRGLSNKSFPPPFFYPDVELKPLVQCGQQCSFTLALILIQRKNELSGFGTKKRTLDIRFRQSDQRPVFKRIFAPTGRVGAYGNSWCLWEKLAPTGKVGAYGKKLAPTGKVGT
jgi:hypothetical protein